MTELVGKVDRSQCSIHQAESVGETDQFY